MDAINLITSCQLLPLATLSSKDQVEPLCKVLINVGLPLIEITLRAVSYTHLTLPTTPYV